MANAKKDVINSKAGKMVTFYRNGDPHFKGLRVPVSQKCFLSLESLLMWLNEKVATTAGVRYIFKLPDGQEVHDVGELRGGDHCVVSSVRRLIRTVDYGGNPDSYWSNKRPSAGKLRHGEQRLFRLSNFEDPNEFHSVGTSSVRSNSVQQRVHVLHHPPQHRHHRPDAPKVAESAARPTKRVITIMSNTHRSCRERVLVNPQPNQNFEDMLFDFSNLLVMTQPPVQTLHSAAPPYKRVCSFSQLFRDFKDVDRFIACGREFVPLEIQNQNTAGGSKKREAPPSSNSSEDTAFAAAMRQQNKPRTKVMRPENDDSSPGSPDFQPDQRYQDHHHHSRSKNPPREPSEEKKPKVEPIHRTIRGKNQVFWPPNIPVVADHGPPRKSIRLDWVHGFNGGVFGSRLHVLPNGWVTYAVGAVAVLLDPRENSQRHYTEHSSSITCIEVHPLRAYIVTGQGRTKKHNAHIRIWDAETLSTYAVFGENLFQTTICSLAFSQESNGDQLLVVDGLVGQHRQCMYIIDWHKNHVVARSKTSRDAVTQAVFHPDDDSTLVTYGKQHVHFWRVFHEDDETASGSSVTSAPPRILRDKKSGLFVDSVPEQVLCVAFDLVGNVITGDSNGCIQVWVRDDDDAYVCRALGHLQHAHRIYRPEEELYVKDPISSLKVLGDGTLLSTSSNVIRAWDTLNDYSLVKERTLHESSGRIVSMAVRHPRSMDGNLVIGTSCNCIFEGSLQEKFSTLIQGHSEEGVALASHPKEHCFVTAAKDKLVAKWSTLQHKLLWKSCVEVPCYSIAYHPNGHLLVVGTANGRFIVLQNSTGMHVISCQINTKEQPIGALNYRSDGKLLALGCEDGNIYIFSVEDEGMVYRKYQEGSLKGHSSPVNHVDWSVDGKYLRSQSEDDEVKFWNVRKLSQIEPSEANEIKFSTETVSVNYNLLGCWHHYDNQAESISCSCRSGIGDKVCVGDDNGGIKMFSYPINNSQARYLSVMSHSGNVRDLTFIFDDSYLISSGEQSSSLIQWSVSES